MKLKILIVIFGLFLITACDNSKSPTESNGDPSNNINFPFKITTQTYNETDNLDQAVQNEFGSNYKIADWNDVVNYCQSHSASQFIGKLSTWQVGYSLFVTRDGAHFWGGTNRHYFITRHDHNLPGNYLSHSNIENHYIDLGSWYNVSMKILAVKN